MITDLQLAHLLADAADQISGRHFRSDTLEVETKSDGSPVTVADRLVEETLRTLLGQHRPDDGLLGEEVGESGPTERRWILDGIDGTHNYVAGRTEWGTLIALTVDGEVTVGLVTSPAMNRRWWAERGGGAWTTGQVSGSWGPAAPLQCSVTDELDGAIVPAMPGATRLQGWKRSTAERVAQGTVRPSAYGHSALRVAGGEVDGAVHLSGGPWDLAAGVVIVEEAGGRFADLWGGRRLDTQTAVFSNGPLFDPLFTIASAERPPDAP